MITLTPADLNRINDAAFALESVAHLLGKEKLLLPHAENLRAIADRALREAVTTIGELGDAAVREQPEPEPVKPLYYLAVGPHCFGVGTSRQQALQRAKRHWPSFLPMRPEARRFGIYTSTDPEMHVSATGFIHSKSEITQIQVGA